LVVELQAVRVLVVVDLVKQKSKLIDAEFETKWQSFAVKLRR
jgi:hypothetical protein